MSGPTREPLAELLELHREIDEAAAILARTHRTRLRCEMGCASCCVDDLTVWSVEAERIRRSHPDLLRDGEPHPVGACAFLDDRGACRIYADRPSVCRSQGLPLRILFEDEAGEIAEHRDICPLNLEGGAGLEELAEEDCWLVGPFELRLAAIEARFSAAREAGGERGGEMGDRPTGERDDARVALRELFETRASVAPELSIRPERSRPTTPR
jgi:Fe-S-cluster containining protein